MKFISWLNKEGNLTIINLDQIIKCYITTEQVSIYLNDDTDCHIYAKNDIDLYLAVNGFFHLHLENDHRICDVKKPEEQAK